MGVSCVMMADLIAETAKLAYQIKAVVSDRGSSWGRSGWSTRRSGLRAWPTRAMNRERRGGVVYKGKIEIRRHRAFGEDRVLGMLRRLESLAELASPRIRDVYGGKPLGVFGQSPATPDAAGRGMS